MKSAELSHQIKQPTELVTSNSDALIGLAKLVHPDHINHAT